MSQFLKKTISGIASMTTVLWSVGGGLLALPGIASAATVSAGDLIKASGPAVYYYGSDMKRYVFPNETVFFSWFNDFSGVRTITDSELAAITIGGNVTVRPGTKLVKITTDPKVYAVTPGGVLHWVESEAIATSLYGSSWANRVVDVPDQLFVNYTIGSSVSTAVHPDGSLVMMSGSSDKYVVENGMKRHISDVAFSANRFNMANVLMTTASYPSGSDVTAYEPMYGDAAYRAGTTPTPQAGTLSVSLASDTPAGMTVPKNSSSVALAKFNLMAGGSDVNVTGLRLHRVGVGSTSDFSNVYLYDANGNRLTTGRSVNSSTNNVEFNSLNLTVRAGQTMPVVVVADFSSPSTTGGQHAFELVDAASVVVSNGTVSGSYPVRGNVFTVGTASAAELEIQVGTDPADPNIGATEAEIANFKMTANTNDIRVERVTLLQVGSVSNSDLSNFKLYQGSTLVASAASMVGDKIVLNFVPPYVISNGTTRVFSLKATVAGRADRTVKTYVEYTTDVKATDTVYNAGASVCIAASCGGSYDGSSTYYSEVTTIGGQLTTTFNGPTSGNIARGAQDVPMFRFALTAPDNDLEIRNLDFSVSSTAAGDYIRGSSGTLYFRDLKVKNLVTGQIVMGPIELTSCASLSSTSDATSGVCTFTDSFTIPQGQTWDLAITADIYNGSEDASGELFDNSYYITLGDGTNLYDSDDVRVVQTGEYLSTSRIVPNGQITGNNFTVKESSLSVSLAGSPSSGTVVRNSSMVPAVGYVFTAGTQSPITITAVTLAGTGDLGSDGTYDPTEFDNVVLSCGLYDGDTRVGVASTPSASDGSMSITSMNLVIPAGQSKTLVAKCTTDSVISSDSGDGFAVRLTSVTAQDDQANTLSNLSGLTVNGSTTAPTIKQTVTNMGTLTVATNSLEPSTVLVTGKDTWINFAQYRATAQNEDVRIEQIAVSSTGEGSNFTGIAIGMAGAVKGQDILPAGTDKYKTIDMTASPIVVPKNTSVDFQVWGKLAASQASSTVSGATTNVPRSGATAKLGIAQGVTSGDQWTSSYSDKMNIRAVGAQSGQLVYATSSTFLAGGNALSGNSFVLRKSKPVVTRLALPTTTLTSGQQMDLYKFQVSADQNGSIALKKVTFALSTATTTNSSLSLNNFRIRRGSSEISTDLVTITSRYGADLEGSTAITNSANTGTAPRVVVTFDNEETISGSGNVYTLVATVGGTVNTGDSVTVSMDRSQDVSAGNLTGYLVSTMFDHPSDDSKDLVGPNVTSSTAPGGTPSYASAFIWSDLSEIPHSDVEGSSSSRDWTNGYLVEDLTQSATLSR